MGHDQVRDGSAAESAGPGGLDLVANHPKGKSTIHHRPAVDITPQPQIRGAYGDGPPSGVIPLTNRFTVSQTGETGVICVPCLRLKRKFRVMHSPTCYHLRTQNSGIASISLADVPDFPCQRYLGSRSYDWKQWRQRDEPEAVGIHGKTPARRLD